MCLFAETQAFLRIYRKFQSFTEEIKKNKIEAGCRRHIVFLSRSELEVNKNIDSSKVIT